MLRHGAWGLLVEERGARKVVAQIQGGETRRTGSEVSGNTACVQQAAERRAFFFFFFFSS